MIPDMKKSLLGKGGILRNLSLKKFPQDNLHKMNFFSQIFFQPDMEHNILLHSLNMSQQDNSDILKLQNLQRYLLDILHIYYFFYLHNGLFHKDDNDFYPKQQ